MKRLVVITIMFIISMNLFGCIKQKSDKDLIEEKESVVLGVKKLPETLNIDESYSKEDSQIVYSLFDGLVELNESGNLIGALAESWEIKENGLEYIFKLRENASWSNGKDIKANDFIEFFAKILKSKENWVKELYSIYGVKEYVEGKGSFEKNVSIIAIEDKILKIRMNNKDERFLYKLTKPQYKLRIINNELNSYKEDYKNLITTGAYKINKINTDEITIELKKNEYYWDEDITSPDKILIKASGTGEKALVSLLMNEIDILSDVFSSEIGELMKKGRIDIFPLKSTKILEFNNKKDYIIKDFNFRKAIEKSIVWELSDFDIITNFKGELSQGRLERDKQKGAIKVSLNSDFNYEKEKEYSKQVAKEFINKSNYNKQTLMLIGEITNDNEQLAEFIKKSVKSIIKVPVEIKLYDKNALKHIINKNEYDILIKNYEYSNVSELNRLENKLIDNEYIIPLYFENLFICKSDNIKYVSYYGDGVLKIKYINIEEK